ncbi:MAG: Gfo/Idh/MocA family oxidoreductase [Planctomycetes bacterium]|nr:Gfo/Idh/MocA family oxidoreductase [Planctomycetota bacterium]
MSLRVVVIGARRAREGTGPYQALQAQAAGAEVVAGWGTTPATTDEATTFLDDHGLEVPGFHDWNALTAEIAPEALLLASPAGTHGMWLRLALEERLHVLCEKPLLASLRPDGQALDASCLTMDADVKELAASFAAHDLVLQENCQWPFVLDSFYQLHPEVKNEELRTFSMSMAPSGAGLNRWLETLSHPVSVLQSLLPGPVQLENMELEATQLNVRWVSEAAPVEVRIDLRPADTWPRPATLSLNGRTASRRVEVSDYSIHLDGDGRSVPCPDPMASSVAAFVAAATRAQVQGGAPVCENLVRRQSLLAQLLSVWPSMGLRT